MACRSESLIIGHVTKALKLFVIVTIMTTIIVSLICNETIISQITFCSNYGSYMTKVASKKAVESIIGGTTLKCRIWFKVEPH